MPNAVKAYKEGRREYLEVCPLDVCTHPVGPKLHWIYERPKGQELDDFVRDALQAVAEREN